MILKVTLLKDSCWCNFVSLLGNPKIKYKESCKALLNFKITIKVIIDETRK